MFENLLTNKLFKSFFAKQFKDIALSNGLKTIVLKVNDDGSFEPSLFKEETVTITKKEYDELLKAIESTL